MGYYSAACELSKNYYNCSVSKDELDFITSLSKKRIKISMDYRKNIIKQAINAPIEIKKYVKNNHMAWLNLILDKRVEYREIFASLFDVNKDCKNNAFALATKTKYFSIECLYMAINYINNAPNVIIQKELKIFAIATIAAISIKY